MRLSRALWGIPVIASTVALAAPASAADPVTCAGVVATIIGTDGDDTIVGTEGNDVIAGLGGTDEIAGGGGHDILCGQDGASTSLTGGPGRDTLIITTPGHVDGGPGNDVIDASGAPPGTTRLVFSGALSGVRVNLDRGWARGFGRDVVKGIADVDGTPFDDRIVGDDLGNTLTSGAGNDTLDGREGNDFLSASTGVDTLTGGGGDDSLTGGGENDTYRGSAGDDAMYEFTFSGDDVMDGGVGRDQLRSGSGDDALYGGPGRDDGDGGSDATSQGDYCAPDVEIRANCERTMGKRHHLH